MSKVHSPLGSPMQRILQCVQQQTGLCFRPRQMAQTSTAISRAMQRVGESEPNDYASRLETDLESLDDLIAELVVGETLFFRYLKQFEFIRQTLSAIMLDQRHRTHPLRAWSAACATGEEPYSLAIRADEMGLLDRTHICATDISRVALERAKLARYRDWSFRGTEAKRAKRRASQVADEFVLRDSLRKSVHCAYLNLALDVYPSHVTGTRDLDLILCRNVLIYFDQATIARVARRMHDCLVPGGWLVTAASDPPLDDFAPFETVSATGGVYYRRALRPNTQIAPTTAAVTHPPYAEPKQSTSVTTRPANDRPTDRPTSSPLQHGEVAAQPTIAKLQRLLDSGDYDKVISLSKPNLDNAATCVLHVKALANEDAIHAEEICRDLVKRHPLSVELSYLHGVLLMESRRDDAAIAAIRKTLYLDRTVAIAHFVLGSLARRVGDADLARRSLKNAHQACLTHPATDIVRFAEDETYSSLLRVVELQLQAFGETPGDTL